MISFFKNEITEYSNMICSFCRLEGGEIWEKVKEGQPTVTYNRCSTCKTISKKCKKGKSMYYSIEQTVYVPGDKIDLNLNSKVSSDPRLLVLDYHNVTDLFNPEELTEILKNLKIPVIILSYVGSTTITRINTHAEVLDYKLPGWLCFQKKETADPGSKGHFLGILKEQGFRPILFDDSEDNIMSALAADCDARLITSRDDVKVEVGKLL